MSLIRWVKADKLQSQGLLCGKILRARV